MPKQVDGCPNCGEGKSYLQYTSIEISDFTAMTWRWGWVIDVGGFEGGDVIEASYCPYCGEKLPTGLLLEELSV